MQTSRLKEIRNALGLSQSRFGSLLGIPQTTYANYESGKVLILDKIKLKLIELGFNMNWSLTGEGQMLLDDSNNAKEK